MGRGDGERENVLCVKLMTSLREKTLSASRPLCFDLDFDQSRAKGIQQEDKD